MERERKRGEKKPKPWIKLLLSRLDFQEPNKNNRMDMMAMTIKHRINKSMRMRRKQNSNKKSGSALPTPQTAGILFVPFFFFSCLYFQSRSSRERKQKKKKIGADVKEFLTRRAHAQNNPPTPKSKENTHTHTHTRHHSCLVLEWKPTHNLEPTRLRWPPTLNWTERNKRQTPHSLSKTSPFVAWSCQTSVPFGPSKNKTAATWQ